jgi:hypothetical protein
VVPSSPQNTTPVDFHIGDQISATVTYDGTHLSVNLIDNVSHVTFSDSEAINLSSVLGGNAAYVGFTGATGNDDSVQKIDNWDFTGTGVAPTITVAAASSPVPVTGTKAHLTVTAESNSAGTLSYAWSILHQPPGAAVPTFKPNSSTSSAASSVHFFKAGTYVFRVTVTDSNGGSSVSDVLVVVQQTPTQIKVTPHKAQIVEGTTQQFNGAVFDQFGHTFQTQPAITYGVSGAGGGTIIATSGLYTAGDTIGHLVITATADELTGVAGATVIS